MFLAFANNEMSVFSLYFFSLIYIKVSYTSFFINKSPKDILFFCNGQELLNFFYKWETKKDYIFWTTKKDYLKIYLTQS